MRSRRGPPCSRFRHTIHRRLLSGFLRCRRRDRGGSLYDPLVTVRSPAVAGMFYESRPDRLEKDVRDRLAVDADPADAFGAIAPHAGYMYSGGVAGAVYARVRV